MKESITSKILSRNTLKEEESISQERMPSPEEFHKLLEEKASPEHVLVFEKVLEISSKIKEVSGKGLLVGGCVRDYFMGKIPKDFDMEVYMTEMDKLEKLLSEVEGGSIKKVGKAFGIIKVGFGAIDIDVSIPRTDSKMGEGHKGFKINTDPNMSIKEAARRRDFTMNTLAADPLTGAVYDPFNGIQDIRERILRVTDEERFRDDPLRVLRAMQFIGRHGLNLEPVSARIIQETAPNLKHISKERFGEEWDKLMLKSERPSVGIVAGMALGILKEVYPELLAMMNTPQEYEWHPEGDVLIHTLMVLDEAAAIAKRENLDEDQSKVLLYTALCHDLGKVPTTEFVEGKIRSRGHEMAGVEPARNFLDKINLKPKLREQVEKLVGEHLAPALLYTEFYLKNPDDKKDPASAIRRLAKRIHPATIKLLTLVGESDHRGRGPYINKIGSDKSASEEEISDYLITRARGETEANISELYDFIMPTDYPAGKWLMEKAGEFKVQESKPENLVNGKQLAALGYKGGRGAANWKVGVLVGEIIQLANDLRDEGVTNARGEKYDSSDRVLIELTEWVDEPQPHMEAIKDPAKARDKLKEILESHRKTATLERKSD